MMTQIPRMTLLVNAGGDVEYKIALQLRALGLSSSLWLWMSRSHATECLLYSLHFGTATYASGLASQLSCSKNAYDNNGHIDEHRHAIRVQYTQIRRFEVSWIPAKLSGSTFRENMAHQDRVVSALLLLREATTTPRTHILACAPCLRHVFVF